MTDIVSTVRTQCSMGDRKIKRKMKDYGDRKRMNRMESFELDEKIE